MPLLARIFADVLTFANQDSADSKNDLAVLTAAYGISHLFRCASIDCVFIGAIQVSCLSFTVGLILGWHCWTRIRRHHYMHARPT